MNRCAARLPLESEVGQQWQHMAGRRQRLQFELVQRQIPAVADGQSRELWHQLVKQSQMGRSYCGASEEVQILQLRRVLQETQRRHNATTDSQLKKVGQRL